MIVSGKLIRLFLADGQPNGLRTIEISNMTIHGTIFPRPQLNKFMIAGISKKTRSIIENIFELKVKNAFAKMAIINNKYVVLKGSTAVMDNRQSIPNVLVKLRQDLIDTGIMLNNGNGLYIFMQDATFNSPSYAASAIVGGAANGRKLWKREGKMLKEFDKEMADNGEECD